MPGFFSRLKDGSAFQIKFKDRYGAGVALATALRFSVKPASKDKESPEGRILVLGIPRGGVIVADVIAQKLKADFGIIMAKKLSAPDNKENAIGAVMHDGYTYLDEFLVTSLKVPPDYVAKETAEKLQEIQERISLYDSHLPKGSGANSTGRHVAIVVSGEIIRNRTIILVDDGIASGSTIIAASRWLRQHGPSKLVIAAPVALPQTVDLLRSEADSIEVLSQPSNFGSVNQFYQSFDQVSDERIIEILDRRN